MHDGPWIYIQEKAWRYGPFGRVVEFGGRNVNGSVREHFAGRQTAYLSLDIVDGEGVDVVADAADWKAATPYDAVVCTEVLEHAERWREIIMSAWRALGINGYLLLTCATDPRKPHSAAEGGPLPPGEWYGNVRPGDLADELGPWFEAFEIRVDRRHGDLYLTAVKGPGDL